MQRLPLETQIFSCTVYSLSLQPTPLLGTFPPFTYPVPNPNMASNFPSFHSPFHPLPDELLEIIIDYACHEVFFLLQIGLTCRLWLSISRQPRRWSDATPLRGMPRMKIPNCAFQGVGSEEEATLRLQHVGTCLPGVKAVETSWTKAQGLINGEGLRAIADKFRKVERLDLYGSNKIDDWSPLKSLGNLETLLVGETSFTDAGLKAVSHSSRLKVLRVSSAVITAAGLRYISSLSSLESLHMDGCSEVGNSGLKHLAGLVSLVTIDLRYSKVTGEGLVHLTDMTRLESLSLGGCEGVGDEGIVCILKLASLVELNMDGTKITEEGIKRLEDGLPRLSNFLHY